MRYKFYRLLILSLFSSSINRFNKLKHSDTFVSQKLIIFTFVNLDYQFGIMNKITNDIL